MKKAVIILCFPGIFLSCNTKKEQKKDEVTQPMAAPVAVTGDNSRNSLDWNGVYRGVMPCADCEGIKTEITLNTDGTFTMATQYLGKSTEVLTKQGSFEWNEAGTNIMLTDSSNIFQVGENMLRKLDLSGNKIEGELSEMYKLTKVGNELEDRYWKLIELNGKPVAASQNPKKEAHMILKKEGNTVNGNGSCNSFRGSYEVTDGMKIKFSKVAATLMACPDMQVEDGFFKVLEMADNYYVNGDTLQLNKARMAPLAKFAAVYFTN